MLANQVLPASNRLEWAATCHAGSRPINEDRVYVDESRGWFTVVDGIGGPGKGDVAADLVLASLRAAADPQAALTEANARILESVQEAPEAKGMGATMSLVVVAGDRAEIFHIGETRVYLVREGRLSQLTEDHTLAMQLVKLKQIQPEDAASHPARKSILRYLGKDELPKVESQLVPVEPGDVLILCSDGLYAGVSDQELLTLAGRATGAPGRLEEFVDARAAEAQDNLSAVLVRIPAVAEPPSPGPRSVSGQLRSLTESLLASESPAEDLSTLGDDLLGLVIAASGASCGLLVFESSAERLVAASFGEPEAVLGDFQDALAEAFETSRPVHRGQDVVLPSVSDSSRSAFCLRLPAGMPLEVEAVEPYLELAAWYGPLSRIVALRKAAGQLS